MRLGTCIGSFAVVAALVSLQAGSAAAALLQVPEDHATIAAALAAASSGDTVSIAPGTYYEHDLLWPPAVSVLGRGSSPDLVTIDAQYLGRVLGGEGLIPQNELALLTLRNGDALGWPGSGLMVTGDPLVHDLVIEDCRGSFSGVGMYVHGNTRIERCVFRNNRCSDDLSIGGGLYCTRGLIWLGSLEVIDCTFIDNQAGSGGGLYSGGGLCSNLIISGNSAWENGGGALLGGPHLRFENSVLIDNHADNNGGGLWVDASAVIAGCTIAENSARDLGGGLYLNCSWDDPSEPQLEACLIAFNSAGLNGGGIRVRETPTVTLSCCDVFGNSPNNFSTMPDPTGHDGNISLDPAFCGRAGGGDFTIATNSPCAPANNLCGVLIGAGEIGCEGTEVESTSWGRIKSLY